MAENKMKLHWDNVYYNKNENEVSWYQKIPKTSLDHIKSLNLNLDSKIIDVGAGESRLVDNLLDLGFNNIDVLDISKKPAIIITSNEAPAKSLLRPLTE